MKPIKTLDEFVKLWNWSKLDGMRTKMSRRDQVKKLTKKQIKEEILRVVGLQENAYWEGDDDAFLCLSFSEYELTKQVMAWVKEQEVLIGYHNNVESSHFITNADDKSDLDSTSCAAIFRTMMLIEFAKSLGVKI